MQKEKRKISNRQRVKHAAYVKCLKIKKEKFPNFINEFSKLFMDKKIQLANGDKSKALQDWLKLHPYVYSMEISWSSIWINIVAQVTMTLPCKRIEWVDELNEHGNKQYTTIDDVENVHERITKQVYVGRMEGGVLNTVTRTDLGDDVKILPLAKFYDLVDKHQELIDEARKIQSQIEWAHQFRTII